MALANPVKPEGDGPPAPRTLLLVAHGQPSDPLPAARELVALAARVAQHLPGWRVSAATLAEPGALERLQDTPPGLVFPVFMAAGWFTRVALPQRLGAAGLRGWQVLAPMGTMAALHDLALRLVRESGAEEVLLAAHGSGRSPAPAQVARDLAARIAQDYAPRRIEVAFIEEAPFLSKVSGWHSDAICLPFFAMSGEHVVTDLPEALAEAGFPGRILPALGLSDDIPRLIADAAKAAAEDLASPETPP